MKTKLASSFIAAVLFLSACGGSSPVGQSPSGGKLAARSVPGPGLTTNLPRSSEEPVYNLEFIGSTVNPANSQPIPVPSGGELSAAGWAVDQSSKRLAGGVDVVIDGKPYSARYGLDRPDVANYFKIAAYAKSGFSFSAAADAFGKGSHQLSIRVVSSDQKSYFEGLALTINIE